MSDTPPDSGPAAGTAKNASAAGTAQNSSDEIDLLEVARVLRARAKVIVTVPLLLGMVTLGITFLIPPSFTANTVVIPPAQQSSSALSAIAGQLGALGSLAGATGALKSSADQYIAFLRSRNVSDRIIERFKLHVLYEKEFQQDTRMELSRFVRLSAGKKDGLITIEVDDRDPKRAADIANAYVDELRRINSEFAIGEASQRRAFFETQLKLVRASLSDAEDLLNSSGVSPSMLNAAPQAAVAAVAKLKANVAAQEIKIASMRGFAADGNPDLKQAGLELAALRAQLAQLGESTPTSAAPGRYMEKYRNFKYQETLFELMAKQYELARLDEARDGSMIQVLDAAIAPERKSHPKKGLISVVATIVAAAITAVLAVLYDLWWSRLKTTTPTPVVKQTAFHQRET